MDFVRFVKKVLLFETISIAYGLGVQQYVQNGFDVGTAFISALITVLIAYFAWYRLNMKYFNKRIVSPYDGADSFVEATYTTQNVARENAKPSFCRKCGNKLFDGAKYCGKCGTEVIEGVRGNNDDLR